MPKREQFAPAPEHAAMYVVEPGDQWIRVVDLRREHYQRTFEARAADGSGVRGPLIDAQWHMLHSVIFLTFRDEERPVRSGVDGWLLMKPVGWDEPAPPPVPEA